MVQAALRGKNGLVVLPTRELALQVHKVFDEIGSSLRVRTAVLIGGDSMRNQIFSLQKSRVS